MRSTNLFLTVFIAALVAGPASAGKNDGGAMIVHTNDAIVWTYSGQYCESDFDNPLSCEGAGTQTNKDETSPVFIWFIASFHPDAEPGVKLVFFGIDHNLPPDQGYFVTWGFCAPPNSIEVPYGNWPEDVNDGTTVAGGSNWEILDGNLFPFYYFVVFGFEGAYLGTGINPQGGYASFLDDSIPSVEDPVERFGTVRWYEPGENDCPLAPLRGACCLPDATCLILFEADCEGPTYDGVYQGDGTTCELDCGACCYWRQSFDTITRRCVVTGLEDCLDEDSWNEIQIEVLWGDPAELVLIGSDWGAPGEICTNDPDQSDEFRYCWDPRNDPTSLTACCLPSGVCMFRPDLECDGEVLDDICAPNPCLSPPPGACCFPDGSCQLMLENECVQVDGDFQGEGTVCDPNPCPQPPLDGACCYEDQLCAATTEDDCYESYGGYLWLAEEVCEPNPCPPTATEETTLGRIKTQYR